MFWGLIMEPHRRYTQVVKKPFHISMAAMDVETSGPEPAQVICGYEGKHYLLCTLKKGETVQCTLNLEFGVGKEISFATNGTAHIHLTGYLTDDLDEYYNSNLDDLEDEVEEEESDMSDSDQEAAEITTRKRSKRGEEGPAKKKSKTAILLNSTLESDSDDSDVKSSDFDDSEAEEEEEADLVEEEAEDEEDEEGESSMSETEEVVSPKAKTNGVASKKEKKTQKILTASPTEAKSKSQKKREKKQAAKEENEKAKNNLKKSENAVNPEKVTPQKKTLEGGVIVQELRVGKGDVAKNGSFVNVYYEGRLKNNNKMFDSTTKGPGFKFRLGKREVIKGWDVGLQGMKSGGKRRIICPPHMAYGAKGSPPVVPPNSTLVFDVELKNVS